MGCGFNPLNPLDPTGLINDTAKDLNPFGMGDPFVMMTSLDFNQNLKIMGESWTKIKHWLVPDMRRDREAMTNSALTNRRWVYGTCRVSGQLAYAESSGSKNEFLHLIVILASHPVASFQKVYLDDKPIEDYGTNAEYKLFNGTQTTACAEMIAASAGKWTANHILKGCAYIYLQLTYDETLFASGLPTVKVVLNGKPVYDPRTGTTTGVSNPNVKVVRKYVDDMTGGYTGWNDNPALCVRDYMLTPEELGGMGCTIDEIDDASIITAANICDQWVYKTTDGTQQEKRFTCSGTFEINSTPKKIVDALLQSMAGTALFIQGKWQIFAGACGSTTDLVTLDESWLNGGISFKIGANKSEKINTIKGTFVDPDDHWAAKGFPPVTSAAYIAEDGNEELSEDVSLNFTISPSMAQRLGKIIMEQSRRNLQVDYPCNYKAYKLTPHQLVRVNNTLLGWNQKLMRVLDWEDAETGGIKLTLIEEDPEIYEWLPGDVVEIPEVPLTILPDPWVVSPPSSLTLTPRIYDYNSGTATRVDLDVSWTAGGPGQLRYELQYRLVGGTWSGIINVGGDTLYTLPTLAAGSYEVRLRGTNSIGAQSDWINATQAVPLPDTTVPNVTGLEIVGQGNNYQFVGRDIALGWNYVSPREDTDVSGPGRGSSWFRYYVVEVYTTGDVLRRTDYTTHERYTYSYEMNRADGSGTALRNVKFSVRIMSAWGALSATAATITVSNPNIAKLGALALVGGINTLSVGLPQISEPDFSGYDVHASQTPGFTPGAGNKINSGGPETVVTKINMSPGTWYVRAAGRDSFGSDGANFSDEYSVAVSSLVVTPAMLDGAARTDFFVRDTILYFDVAVLTWDAGYIDRGDHTYTLAAGTLTAANASYIIATFEDSGYTATLSKTAVTAGLPTLTANQSIIAVTSADATPQGNYYCYVRQANSVSIEGALIRNATIQDGHVVDLSADKLTAGSVTSQKITLTVTEAAGDVAIQAGKTDFGQDTTPGFILGIDDSDSNKAKFEIGGSATNLMKWDGITLTVKGAVEASSLKADTVMVQTANVATAAVGTLQIAGNAVTVPWSADISLESLTNVSSINIEVLSDVVIDSVLAGQPLIATMRLMVNRTSPSSGLWNITPWLQYSADNGSTWEGLVYTFGQDNQDVNTIDVTATTMYTDGLPAGTYDFRVALVISQAITGSYSGGMNLLGAKR